MNDGAAYLVDHVFADTPVRHWVLSLPHPLRYILAYDTALVNDVLGIHIEEIFRCLRWKAKSLFGLQSVTQAHPGAVTVIQRSSSNLALNIHFHSLVTDGFFLQEDPGGPVVFRELPAPSDDEVKDVAERICERVIGILKRKGRWQDDPEPVDEDPLAAAEPALANAYQASIRGVLSMGPRRGQRVVRFFGAAAQPEDLNSIKRSSGGGFDLHARQATFSYDREKVERLARYILRPPLAQNHLERLTDGRVVLRLKRTWRDGTTAVIFEPLDLMSKLTALIPRPKTNVIRFHGVYASNANLRSQVVPRDENAEHDCGHERKSDPTHRRHRLLWAELLARVFQIDVFKCPRCSSQMQRVAWILNQVAIRKILDSVGLATDSPEPNPPQLQEDYTE